MADPTPTAPRRRSRLPGVALGISLALLLAGGVSLALWPKPPPTLPEYGALPAFELTDDEGQPFGLASLRGQVWVASFIFTRCETVCPLLAPKIRRIQDATADLGPALRLVSFSVDPDHDTPARLAAWGTRFGADHRRWIFLTGRYEAVKQTVVDGLKVVMERSDDGALDGIFHGSHLVLVDGAGRVRGYYDSNAPDVVERVVADGRALVRGGSGLAAPIATR